MLNDLSGYTRAVIFGQIFPFGLLIGSSLGMLHVHTVPELTRALWIVGFALAFVVAWGVTVVVWSRRVAARLHDELDSGSRAIVDGRATAAVVPARVIRQRKWTKHRPWGLGAGEHQSGLAHSTAFTVLPPDGPPRRVAALSPVALRSGAPAWLALHPTLPEVGVLDLRATNDDVAAAAADPRWRSEKLPTDRTVVGGYAMLVVAGVGGGVTGALIAYLVWLF
ncbi:hypothetical protein [Nocardioides jensenii]|uniref:hypothetical protein n=1 Tax=Nocardioides jensenii TaxID=1843 RepID=UPI0008319621|nr:hypothetical protein [Nocardioides jensenii]